jgi:hypothetical protein
MADPRRMTPEEHGQAHALLVRAVTDPDWQAASQALDDLMGKLVVMRRLLEAEEPLPQRTPRRNGCRPARALHYCKGAWGRGRPRPLGPPAAGGVRLLVRNARSVGDVPW